MATASDLAAAAIDPSKHADLVAKINALPIGDQRCMALRFAHEMNTNEIAAALGWKPCEVVASLNRCMRIVKPALYRAVNSKKETS